MYLLQVWFWLSDEGVEDAIYDSYAMRRFMGMDFAVEQVPDATTLLNFRHLLEEHELRREAVRGENAIFEEQGLMMRGGTHRGRHDHRRADFDEERRRASATRRCTRPRRATSGTSG